MRIERFADDHEFLSNFYPSLVYFEEIIYPSVEHGYQAAKFSGMGMRAVIAAMTPGQAKRTGRKATLPADWDFKRIEIMRYLLFQKFTDPDLRRMLLETGDAELIEGNNWGDTFWGVSNGIGENQLGKLLMEVRAHFAREEFFESP